MQTPLQTTLPQPDLTQLPTRAPDDFDKKDAKKEMKQIRKDLIEWQEKLYAENKQSVLVVLQGMDASGKDGLIRRVFSGINPQGVRVFSFKEPPSASWPTTFSGASTAARPPAAWCTSSTAPTTRTCSSPASSA